MFSLINKNNQIGGMVGEPLEFLGRSFAGLNLFLLAGLVREKVDVLKISNERRRRMTWYFDEMFQWCWYWMS